MQSTKRFAMVLALVSAIAAQGATAVNRPEKGPLPNFDARFVERPDGRDAVVLRSPTSIQLGAAEALEVAAPGAVVRWNVRSGSPQWVAAPAGTWLAAPRVAEPETIAREFLTAHTVLIGLTPAEIENLALSSVVPAPDGGAHVHFAQSYRGLDVYDSAANVNVSGDGSVRSMGSSLYAGMRFSGAPTIGPAEAAAIAAHDVYPAILFTGEVLTRATERPDELTTFSSEGFASSPTARLVLLPVASGARLAWEVRIAEPTLFTNYRVLVDGHDGAVLLRRNTTRYATARVIGTSEPEPRGEDFTPDAYDLVDVPDAASPTTESPAGWIDGDQTVLRGNNVVAIEGYQRNDPLTDNTTAYGYAFGTNRSATVNAWYVANEFHDWARARGFDELRGNYQNDNFGLGGVGGDPMNVVTLSTAGRNNAFFGEGGIDGEIGNVTFLWSDCEQCADKDGYPENGGERHTAMASDVVVHEYVHGMTTRLTGGPALACEVGVQGGGMDEGWSDYFGYTYFDDPTIGRYFVSGRGFIRSALNDLDYDDVCDLATSCGTHDTGLIWQATVWELRESFRALDPVGGVETVDRLMIEGLATSPCFPSFLDMRDAILDADTSLHGSAHHPLIWNVFAARGMGQGAFSLGPDDKQPVASYTVPLIQRCTAPPAPGSLSAAPDGANAIRLSYSAPGAAALQVWREDLDHPFDRPSWIASTTDTASYVDTTVQGGKSYRYHVVPLGSAGTPCAGGASPTADATATGTCEGVPIFDPATQAIDATSCAVTVSWQPAQEACPGSGDPILYSVYRGDEPGFDPSSRNLIGTTTSTSIGDTPPENGRPAYYLVLAQHGTESDAADQHDRAERQVIRWEPAIPASARSVVHDWSFDAGAEGWTVDNSADPVGGWVRVAPTGTHYAGALFAPDEAAGGSGLAWVTGDAAGPSQIHDFDSDGPSELISPVFDGTGGATLLSFDYWSHDGLTLGRDDIGLKLVVDNGVDTAEAVVAKGMTVQEFDSPGRHGWQRAAFDLATLIAPSATMHVRFVAGGVIALTEYGIDNVRVEQGTTCGRSGLSVTGYTVDDTNPGSGNGNGVLEPGETAVLTVELTNDGSVTAFSPVLDLVRHNPAVEVHDATVSLDDVPSGQSASASGISLSLSPDAQCIDTVALDFEIRDAAGTTAVDTIEIEPGYVVTTTLFTDTFETDLGWIVKNDPGAGAGQWQRVDPVGTLDGGVAANPEDDSPNDAGTFCYVTENGPPGGGPDDHDLDAAEARLYSPPLDFSGFKRAWLNADVWFYTDSDGTDPFEDYLSLVWENDDQLLAGGGSGSFDVEFLATPGWVSRRYWMKMPMVDMVRVGVSANDQGPATNPSYTDSTVEAAIDNVRIEADEQICDATGVVHAPNTIGGTLRVSSSGGSEVALTWTASPVDATHDGAAFYRIYSSEAADSGFGSIGTTTTTGYDPPAEGAAATEFFLVTAVNGAGDSGDAPAP